MALHLVPRQLRYIQAVAEHGSVQGASRALGIAASAIDRHVHAMEEASQTLLFERLPRGMRLTAAGEAVIVMARRWQADAERLDSGLKDLRGQEGGIVRIASMDSLANGMLAELVDWVQVEHPRMRLAIDIVTPAEAAQELDVGTVDLVVAFNLPPHRHQHHIWSQDLPFGCAMAPDHPLAGHSAITLNMLSETATASQSDILPIRQYLDRHRGWLFSQNTPMLVTNSLQLLKRTVRQGRLVLITSEMDVLPELEAGELVFVPIKGSGLRAQTISLAIDARRPMARATRVISEKANALLGERMGARRSRLAKP